MPGFGTSYLGDLSTRLQRLLGFDGAAPVSFTGEAVPVILVGDATRPGYGDQQGRRFLLPSGVTAAGGFFYVRSTGDVIIEKITSSMEVAGVGNIEWRWIASTTAPGAAPAVGGLFLDRSASLNDRPPMEFYQNPAATAGSVLANLVTSAAAPVGLFTDWQIEPFLLARGQAMGWLNNAGGTNVRFQVWGKTL